MFLYGDLVARGSSARKSLQKYGHDWCCPAYFYWSLALDIFSAAHSLQTPPIGSSISPPVDWEMSLAKGRTLLRLANEVNSKTREAATGSNSSIPSYTPPVLIEEPRWPRESIFSTIMSRRPPERSSFRFTAAHDLMTEAWDTLSHGILHMPRRRRRLISPPVSSPPAAGTMVELVSIADSRNLSTCVKELYTIGSEVLFAAEHFRPSSERQQWAASADSILGQLKIDEPGQCHWQGPIRDARVRCWTIIVGHAWDKVVLDDGDGDDGDQGRLDGLLHSDKAEEARRGLTLGTFHFPFASLG